MRINRRSLLAAPTLLLLPRASWGQQWPSRPLRLICTFSPGGAADMLARGIAALMPEDLGQNVIVENRTGAAGNIGTEMLARATDGHTILLASTGPLSYHHILFKKLPFDPLKDIAPVGFVAHSPNILVTRNDSGWKTLEEVVAAARKRPGELTIGSSGIGTTQHLTGELLQQMADIKLIHVPYRGGALSLQDLLGGRLDLNVTTGSGASTIRDGGITALGVTGATRIPAIPDIPTMVEQGYPEFVATAWYGIVGPASMPPEIVARLNGALRNALSDKSFVERMSNQTLDVQPSTAEEFDAFIAAERKKWEPITRPLIGTL